MIRALLRRAIARNERRLGVSLDYLRHIADRSPAAFIKFGLFMPLAEHRKHLDAAPYFVARLGATRHEDCGTCVQIEANLALEAGVAREVVAAAARGRPGELPEELALAYRFGRAVAAADEEGAALRQEIGERFGADGLLEMALGVASARVFPATKRALGYAQACSAVELEL